MKDSHFSIKMNRDGELIQEHLHDTTRDKYKADSVFLSEPVSCGLMIACGAIDFGFFISLFEQISYGAILMIAIQASGLVFAADVVSAYAGILAKRIRQGLSSDKFNLYLLLAVPIFALVINAVLRFATMPLLSIDGVVNAETIALTIIGIVTPIFTSIGNFAISFQTYDPLRKRMCREEMALDEIRDFCRRLEAMIAECKSFDSEKIKAMDRQHLNNAKMILLNDGSALEADVDVQLMAYLGDPASTNMFSKEDRCHRISNRINSDMNALKSVYGATQISETTHVMERKYDGSFLEVAKGGENDEKEMV